MKRMGLLTSAIVVGAVLLSTACSGDAAGTRATATTTDSSPDSSPAAAAPAGVQAVTLTVGNGMSFDPPSVTVRAGQPVELTLQNKGQVPHDFTLADGLSQPVKVTAMGGQTANATFIFEKPGTYSFECSMPGHAAAGMRGMITAQ